MSGTASGKVRWDGLAQVSISSPEQVTPAHPTHPPGSGPTAEWASHRCCQSSPLGAGQEGQRHCSRKLWVPWVALKGYNANRMLQQSMHSFTQLFAAYTAFQPIHLCARQHVLLTHRTLTLHQKKKTICRGWVPVNHKLKGKKNI